MDQSENRSNLPRIEIDSLSGLYKFNPLISWSDALDLYQQMNTLVLVDGGGNNLQKSVDCTKGERFSYRFDLW
jgi:hypothetical protein